MNYHYRTLQRASEGIYQEKGSKFLAYAYPVDNMEEIRQRLSQIRCDHPAAHHRCYAYIMGCDPMESRSFDDGEPRHSAGDPILRQIQSFELTNTMVLVVRYFGGKKLGFGGLVNAYKKAARKSLSEAVIIKKHRTEHWSIFCDYQQLGAVLRIVEHLNIPLVNQQMNDSCCLKLNVRLKDKYKVMAQLQAIQGIVVEELNIGN